FAKWLELMLATHTLRRTLALADTTASLDALTPNVHPQALIAAVRTELGVSRELPAEGIKSRIALRLHRVEVALARRMARGTGVLASIGSCAPFIGLFGTVWGIMDSFVGIS